MNSISTYQNPIVVAVDEEWREIICKYLRNESLTAIVTSSPEDTRAAIANQSILALVVVSDWIFDKKDGITLVELIHDKIPVVTIIKTETLKKYGQKRTFDKVYTSRLQEFCSVPIDMMELISRLKKVIANAEK